MVLLSKYWSRLGTLHLNSHYQHAVRVVVVLLYLHPGPSFVLVGTVPGSFSVPSLQCRTQPPRMQVSSGLHSSLLGPDWCLYVHTTNVLRRYLYTGASLCSRRCDLGLNSAHREGRTKVRLSTRSCSLCGCQATPTAPMGPLRFVSLSFPAVWNHVTLFWAH